MQLEKNFEQAIASISANKDIAREQAEVLSAALSKANIDIVGGDGAFLDRLVNSIGMGKAVDQFLAQSDTAGALVARITDGLLPVKEKKDAAGVVVTDDKKLKVKQPVAE